MGEVFYEAAGRDREWSEPNTKGSRWEAFECQRCFRLFRVKGEEHECPSPFSNDRPPFVMVDVRLADHWKLAEAWRARGNSRVE